MSGSAFPMTNTAMQNVHMDQFIEEVRQRPAIYDTTLPEYCDRSYKRHLWMEICEKFNPDWQTLEEDQREAIGREMKNRWKSIRDAFVREVRYLKEAAKFGEPPAKKRKYIYYDQLSFLLPTVGSRSNTTVNNKINGNGNIPLTHFLHNSSYDDSIEALDLKKEPQEPVANLQEVNIHDVNSQDQPQDLHVDSESDRESSILGRSRRRTLQGIKEEISSKEDKINIWLNWNSKENNDPREPTEEKVEVVPIIDSMVSHQINEPDNYNTPSTNVYDGYGVTADSDYMFLMSLLPSFKKLEEETKSIIKIEISSVLHHAIYGPRRLSDQVLLQDNVKRSLRTPNKQA